MKNFLKRIIPSIASSAILLSNQPYARAGDFTPSKFEVTFYEIGLVNENDTSKRFKVFESTSGQTVDVAASGTNKLLTTNVQPKAGTWTHVYMVMNNEINVSGNDGSCYITSGSSTTLDTDFSDVTSTNSSNAGTANIKWMQFGGNGAGPADPNVATVVNGRAATDVEIYLTNSSDLLTATLTDPNRMVFYGTITEFTTLAGNAGGEVEMSFGLTNAMSMDSACTTVNYESTSYGLSVLDY